MKFIFVLIFLIYIQIPSTTLAGINSSKPILQDDTAEREEETRKKISKRLLTYYQDPSLASIHQNSTEIKTKSQKPTEARTQNATFVSIEARPIQEVYGQEEWVQKILVPGKDGRIQINPTDSWPYSVHGIVCVKFPHHTSRDPYDWGTGTLVAPNVVLTAAHNFYSRKKREEVTEVRFLPAINGKLLPFKEPKVISFYYPQAYKKENPEEDTGPEDYGILILDTPIGNQAGYFGISILPLSELEKLEISVTGYPADKVSDKNEYYEMWGMKGPIKKLDQQYISYEIDTYGGQSGSGVFYQEGDNFFVVGVHVLGDIGVNRATLLTKARYNTIRSWVQESARQRISQRIKEITFDGVQKVDLSSQSIGDFGAHELTLYRFPHLTALNLEKNEIGLQGIRKIVSHFPFLSLRELNLNGNHLTDEAIKALSPLTNLVDLRLRSIGYEIKIDSQDIKDHHTRLYRLHQSNFSEACNYGGFVDVCIPSHTPASTFCIKRDKVNLLTNDSLDALSSFKNLTSLDLSGHWIRSIEDLKGVFFLSFLKEIYLINVTFGPIHGDGIAIIQNVARLLPALDTTGVTRERAAVRSNKEKEIEHGISYIIDNQNILALRDAMRFLLELQRDRPQLKINM